MFSGYYCFQLTFEFTSFVSLYPDVTVLCYAFGEHLLRIQPSTRNIACTSRDDYHLVECVDTQWEIPFDHDSDEHVFTLSNR